MLRHVGVIVLGTVLATAIAAGACALLPPTYEAVVTLEKVERSGILESIHTTDDFRRLICEREAIDAALGSMKGETPTRQALVASLVTRPSSRPNCMEIAVAHRDAATAAGLANALARAGIAGIARERKAAYDVRKRVLEGRIDKLRDALVEAEGAFGRWLDESAVDAEGHDLNDSRRVLQDLRKRAAVETAKAQSSREDVAIVKRKLVDSLNTEIRKRAEEFRVLNAAHDKHIFEKERRYARYRERRDAFAGQEKALAEYLAEAHPDEPELIVRIEATPPVAPSRAPNSSIVASAAIAGLAVSAFVAMVLGFRSPHA